MSEREVELTRLVTEAYNVRDIEALIAHCDSSIEFHAAWAAGAPTVYHGHDGLRRWHRDLEDAWGEEIRLEPEALFDLGESLLAFYVVHARGRHSGAAVAMPGANVMRWRDGLIVYIKAYLDREEALRDLGVTQDELEPIDP